MELKLPIYRVKDTAQVGRFTSLTVFYGTDVTISLASPLVAGATYEATIEYYTDKDFSVSMYVGSEEIEMSDPSSTHKLVRVNFGASSALSSLRLSLVANRTGAWSAYIANLIIRRVGDSAPVERYVAEKWEFHDSFMGSRYVQLNASSHTPINWQIGDYLVYRGLTYTLNNVPVAIQNARPNESSDAFVYENIRFDDEQGKLYDCMVLDITPTTGDYIASKGTNYTGSSVFTLFCAETTVAMRDSDGVWHDVTLSPVAYLGGVIQANLNRLYPQDDWRVDVNPELTGLDDKVISLNQWYVPQALAEIHNQWDVNYICLGHTIKIGYTLNNITGDDSESYVFAYGEGYARRGDDEKSLFKIKRTVNSSQHIITRLRAMGSTRNMPYRYYSKGYDLPQSMFVNNLQLPDTFLPFTGTATKKRPNDPNNKTQGNANRDAAYGYDEDNRPILRHVLGESNDAYIDKLDDASLCPEGIREGSAFWDGSDSNLEEIYPTIKSGTYRDLRAANIPDMDGRVPSQQSSPTAAYPNYDNDERIDVLLGVDNRTNIGDGIMAEADAKNQFQIIRTVRVAQKTLRWAQSGTSDFDANGIAKESYIDTLYTIPDVSPGSYQTEPVTQNVKLFVKYTPSGQSIATVRYRFRIYATNTATGVTTLVAEHVSPIQTLLAGGDFLPVELPSIPNTDADTKGDNDQSLDVEFASDITVKFALEVVTNQGVTVGNGTFTYYIDSAQDVTPEYIWEPQDVADTFVNTPFSIYIKDIGIDLSNISTTGEDATIHFNSGACGGMEFKWNPNSATPIVVGNKKGWKIDIVERYTDDIIHAYYPNANSPLSVDDQYVLLNIEFPDAYIRIAELRLLDAATKYLADNCEPKYTYEPEISDIYIQRNIDFCEAAGHPEKSIYWNLYAGYRFSMRGIPDTEDQVLPVIDNVTIKDVTIHVGDHDIPQVEIVLNDEVEQSTLQKLSVTVDRIYNGIFGQGGSGSSISYSTLLSLLNNEGKKLFLSKRNPDSAAGKITFQQGFQSDKNGEFGDFEEGASGASVYKDDDDNWHVEADFLHARKKLTAKELQIEEVKHVGGQMMLTAAECITDFVIEYDDYYRCFFLMKDDDGKTIYNKWRIGDQAFMQSFNVEKWSNNDDSSADADGLRNRYYWRLVVGSDIESNLSDYNEDFSSDYGFDRNGNLPNGRNLGEYHWIDLSKTQCALLSDAPLAEDKIVQLGNQNGEQDRENAIVIVGAGTSSPYIDEYVGIVSFHLPEPETRLKPGQNVLSGLVNMKSNSTYAGRELSSYFGSIGDMESSISEMDNDINNITRSIEEITSGLDQLSSGNENLLRNTGFTGDYMTMDVSDSEDVDGGTKTYSDPLQHWEHDGANVVPNIVSASGFSVRLNSGRIYQQATKPINGGSMYCLSFRAKGTTLQYSFGGVVKTIALESSVKRYTNRIQIVNPSDNVFKIFESNADVMEIMLTEGSVPNTDWIPSPLDNDKTLAFYQNLTYLANAITNASTSILGGLILTQMIRVGNYRDGAMVAETGGMSGLFTSGNSPFLWGGGTMEQAFYTINKYIEDPSYQATDEEVEQMAKFAVTHGGRAILNDIILRGYIYAKGGVFNGTVYAQDGVFNGTVNATSGVFRNIASPQDRFKIDENGYLECVDARVKGSIYNPLLIINDGNMTGKVTPHWTDPPNPVIDYYVINLAVTGLNIQVDWTWPNNAYIQLPCTDSNYNGAKAHIYNSTASDVIVHGSMTNIGNNYTLTSGKLGIFYCIYVSAGRYVWTQIATS